MVKKVLIIGPLSPPITGVSICNDKIIQSIDRNSFKIDSINTANPNFNEALGKFSLDKLFKSVSSYFSMYKILFADVVYITIGQTFFGVLKYYPFLFFGKLLSKKVILHIHGNYLARQFNLLNGLKKYLFRSTLKLASDGIVLSKSLIPNLSFFMPENQINVVSNFVDEQLLDINVDFFESKKVRDLRIIFLSNLITEKGILDLLEALEILEMKNIAYEAKIAGNIDIKIKNLVLKKINNLNNTDYLGVVSGQQKKNLLLWGNQFVLPTYYKMEGQPISILEAMACGNIIITTKHAGIMDIISEENGLFIKKKSPEDIVEKLLFIRQKFTSFKNLPLKNYLYIKNSFTEKTFINSLQKIFNNETRP